jgi:hypothetical protein
MPQPLPPEFWDKEKQHLAGVLRPHIEQAALAGAGRGAEKLAAGGIYFDTSLVNAAAGEWASRHTDVLLRMFETTNRKVVGAALENWFATPGATYGDLIGSLQKYFPESRAESIAVTEVTRATYGGQLASFREAGAAMPPVWDVPKIGAQPFGPPAHVHCRCDTALKQYKGAWVVVWLTTRDDLTCIKPIAAPWGQVMGCRALQGVCISQGEFLGRKIA